MLTVDYQAKYVRRAITLTLMGGLLTTTSLSVHHFIQESKFLIDLVVPPIASAFILSSLIFLYIRPEKFGTIVRITVMAAGILMCVPAWFFSILAAGSQDIVLLEAMPPVTSILLPVMMAMVIFLQPRIAIVSILATWIGFVTPILVYLVNHPNELTSPRGTEMLITIGPVIFITMALMLISHGLKKEVKELHVERSDLKALSERDSLTGLINRRAGEARLMKEIQRTDARLGIVLFDIDHFKRINDTYGHDIGDATLREVVKRCKKSIRSRDLFIRWGGEEFLILVHNASNQETATVAEKLRLTISATPVGPDLKVTASFGAASYENGDSALTLFKRADEALYEAKAAGRDKVVIRK